MSTTDVEKRPTSQQDTGESRKSRRTRWGQSAREGVCGEVDSQDSRPADVRAAAAKAAAIVAARAGSQPGAAAAGVPRAVLLNASAAVASSGGPSSGGTPSQPSGISSVLSDVAARASAARAALEKARKALALKRQIQEQTAALKAQRLGAIPGLGNASAMLTAGVQAALRALPRSTPLKFDRLGRELDEEGQVVDAKPVVHSTLKVNINREREEKLKQVTHQMKVDKTLSNPSTNAWYDPSLAAGTGIKSKRKGLCFVERGFFTQKERRLKLRMQAQALGISAEAKETQRLKEAADEEKVRRLLQYQRKRYGNADEAQSVGGSETDDDDDDDMGFGGRQQPLHLLQRKQVGIIPDVEWWDAPLLQKCAENDQLGDPSFPYVILESSLTNLVEHPVPIQPVVDPLKPAAPLTVLTPKERTKLRRIKRQEKERDKQDKIRMGLLAPPPPKVKLSNLARVLGTSAASDPSKVEGQVRQQMAQRIKEHEARNEARRLDDDARRKKQISKWTKPSKDLTKGSKVCVYSIKDLSDKRHLFKVDKNAQQLHVTGAAILCPGVGNLIVVEGSDKSLKCYKKLLLKRIKWDETVNDDDNNKSDDVPALAKEPETAAATRDSEVLENHPLLRMKGNAYCQLLWEGVVEDRGFKQWRVYVCKSELEARKLLSDREAEHYWDMLKKYRDPAADL